MVCLSCARQFCNECGIHPCCKKDSSVATLFTDLEPKKLGRPVKADEELLDVRSTGRKRAQAVKPITEGMICEWSDLKNCGGGKFPIVGCHGNLAKHVHHHDKNKLHNTTENLSRVCTDCHNRWHTCNDDDFDPSILHNPEPASLEEFMESELKWKGGLGKKWIKERVLIKNGRS